MLIVFVYFLPWNPSFRYQASKDDLAVHAALSKAPSADYVNVSQWYNHIEALLRIRKLTNLETVGTSFDCW